MQKTHGAVFCKPPAGLETYLPNLHYWLLDEGSFDLTELNPLKNLVSAIFRLEKHTSPEAILDVVANLVEWLSAPEQERIRRSFSIWINRVLKPTLKNETPVTDLVEIKTMLSQRVAEWQKQFKQEGIAQGIAQGLAKGEAKGQAKTLAKLINVKFGVLPDWAEQKLSQASSTELDSWTERLLNTESLDQLFNDLQ